MNPYNDRNKIIKLFEDKNIMPSNYAPDAKSEPEEYDGVEKSEQKCDESIGERVILRRQKSDELNKMITDKADNEQLDTTDMPDLESEESSEKRRNQRGQGLKKLTPQQMLSRLPITFAQLKAGNNSQKLKNEIRQLLYSLYRSKQLSKTIYKHLMNAI